MGFKLTSNFKDHFSDGSEKYSSYRPQYPEQLFSYLSSITPENKSAWDCATGSGQSAVGLSGYFDEVIATDASQNQITNAIQKKGISYKVENAEQTSIKSNSIDLITVAQALHWFNLENFTTEVQRVLKIKGVLAVWTYGLLDINSEINKVIYDLYSKTLDPYWPPERNSVEAGYKDIKFPFEELKSPVYQMTIEWELSQLIGYLCTWSAVKRYETKIGENPVENLYKMILDLWGDPKRKRVTQWPLVLKVWINDTNITK